MMDTRKIMSLVIVAAMVLMGFSALLPMAGAEIINVEDDRDIEIGWENLGGQDIFPGSMNVNFNIRIDNENGIADIMNDDDPIEWANLSISTTLRDEEGTSVTTPISNWDVNRVDDEATIWDNWDTHTFSGFQFDVKGNAVPGVYNLTVTLDYKNDIGTADSYIGYILFEIKNRVEVPDIGGLTPGDLNVKKNIDVHFDNGINPNEIVDIELSITLPDTGFTWFGVSGSTITKSDNGPFDWNDWWDVQLILSVSSSKSKGEYVSQYTTTYTINGVEYTETGEIIFTVGDLPMLEVSVGTDTLAQGTSKVTWSLTFTNVGTVDLLDIKLMLDDDSDAFTFMPADHWEDGGTVTYSWLELGDIAVGASVTQTMDVGIDLYIPEGMHKVMFTFWGMYYDPDTATYEDVTVDWTNGFPGHVPRVNGATFDPDTSTVDGPFIEITVTDTAMDLMLTSQTALSLGGRLVDNGLQISVQNYGNIDFGNVILKLETNTATSPFLNVIDPTAPFSEEVILVGTLNAGATGFPILRVDLKPGISAGVHSVPTTITAVNMDMGEAVETVINARITITGVGPKLEITETSPGEIKNGKDFTLTLTITNNGDDTARNVVLTMPNAGAGLDLAEEPNEINGDVTAPVAGTLPIYLDDIAPGASVTVEVPMKANKDMSSGHVYLMTFRTTYTDSFDNPANVDHGVSLKSTGFGGTTLGLVYYSLIILFLVAAIFLIAYTVIYVKKYKKANPKGGMETQTQYTPQTSFPEEPAQQAPPPPME